MFGVQSRQQQALLAMLHSRCMTLHSCTGQLHAGPIKAAATLSPAGAQLAQLPGMLSMAVHSPGPRACRAANNPCLRGQVSSEAECSAAGPWGLTAMIEGIMAREAQASMTQFLDYCAAECNALRFSLPQVPGHAAGRVWQPWAGLASACMPRPLMPQPGEGEGGACCTTGHVSAARRPESALQVVVKRV